MLIQSPEALALYVREQRKSKKLTQSDIAEQVGIKQDTVSDFENRPKGTKVETLFKILAATGLEVHILPSGTPLESNKHQWDEPW